MFFSVILNEISLKLILQWSSDILEIEVKELYSHAQSKISVIFLELVPTLLSKSESPDFCGCPIAILGSFIEC